jgi:hypothetical protein
VVIHAIWAFLRISVASSAPIAWHRRVGAGVVGVAAVGVVVDMNYLLTSTLLQYAACLLGACPHVSSLVSQQHVRGADPMLTWNWKLGAATRRNASFAVCTDKRHMGKRVGGLMIGQDQASQAKLSRRYLLSCSSCNRT